tara:strand:+ start:1827 stop:2213 length:387 start_codon:yes stop_codon:yes gene_type:complete
MSNEIEPKNKEIALKHKIFLKEYLSNGFNGAEAYAKAYNKDSLSQFNICKNGASLILNKPHIKAHLKDLFEAQNVGNSEYLARLNYLAFQNTDLQVSLKAVLSYLKMVGVLDAKPVIEIQNYVAKFKI